GSGSPPAPPFGAASTPQLGLYTKAALVCCRVMRTGIGVRRRPFAEVPDDATPYAVRMRDGVLLATDVYLPTGVGPWPALLSRLPYDKAGEECFMPQIARWFTARGYAVVVQDVRGKVRSDG